jgi:hypothetical protein
MSYISNPNQPIVFGSLPEVNCDACADGTYKQLVDINDQLFFQLESEPCTEALAISSPSAVEWTSAAGRVCGNADEFGIYSFNFTTTEAYQVYKILIVVNTLSAGELTIHIQGGDSYTFYTAGSYEIYLSSDVAINGDLTPQIYLTGPTFVGCFSSSIRVYGVGTAIQAGWVDLELNVISLVDSIVTVVDNYVTVALDMASQSIPEGCFRLAITDNCDYTCGAAGILNGEFTSSTAWSYPSGGWTIAGGAANFAGDEGDFKALYNSQELCAGIEYTVTIVVSEITDARIAIFCGTGSTSSPLYIDTVGTHEFTLVAGTGDLRFAIRASAMADHATAQILSVFVSIALLDIEFTKYSNVISIGDYSDCGKFLKIGGCNASNQFGLAFSGTSFLPSVRVEGVKYKPQYDIDVDSFRSASGNWSANYVDRRKKWTFHFGRVPENILDFLSVVLFFDNCYINDELYFPANDEFPQIDWNDADNKFGRFDVEMYEKKNKVSKVLCTAADANCLPSILDNDIENFLLTESGERITTEGDENILW